MKGSRPPTLLTQVHRLVRDDALFGRDDVVLCACSGGPDSNALLHALALLRRRVSHQLVAVGVDHGLRAAARSELEVACSLAEQCDVPFESVRVHVGAGANLQARARQARYGALLEEASRVGAQIIATGHTADDRAETLLMRLLRGSGPRGLAVLPPQTSSSELGYQGESKALVRPLLRCRRADVMAHLQRHGVPYCEDPSNQDTRFMRVRVRHQLMPLLEQLSPSVVEHLCSLADMLGADLFAAASSGPSEAKLGPFPGLNRSQLSAIGKLLRTGKGRTTVRVSGGRDLELKFLRPTPGARQKK